MTEFTYPGYDIEVSGPGTETRQEHNPRYLWRRIDAIPDGGGVECATVPFAVGTQLGDLKPRLFDEAKIYRLKRQAWDDLVAFLGRDEENEKINEIYLQDQQEDRQG